MTYQNEIEALNAVKAATAEFMNVLLDQSLPLEKKVTFAVELASGLHEEMKIAHNEGRISAVTLERIGRSLEAMKMAADRIVARLGAA